MRPGRHVVCAVIGLWCAATTPATAQRVTTAPAGPGDDRRGSGFVLGQVVDAVSGRPVTSAIVTLSPGAGGAAPGPVPQGPRVLADESGRFLLRDLAAGTYRVSATAPGYLPGGYGQQRVGDPTLPYALEEGQRTAGMTIRLWRSASLSGTVVDELGAPVTAVMVDLLRRETATGRTRVVAGSASGSVRTDDHGAYAFGDLTPGDYIVAVPANLTQMPLSLATADAETLQSFQASGSGAMSAGVSAMSSSMLLGGYAIQTDGQGNWGGSRTLVDRLPFSIRPDGRLVGYPTTFYPSAVTIAEAPPLTLAAGDARTGMEVRLRPMTLSRVAGTVVGPSGPIPNFAVHLIPAYASGEMLERWHESAVTATDAKGEFTFLGAAPGSYVVKAWRTPQALSIGRDTLPPDTSLWGEASIAVGDAAIAGLTISLKPGVTLAGRLEFADGTDVPPPARIQTMLSAAFAFPTPLAAGNLLGTRVSATGEFVTQGLPPGRHFVIISDRFSLAPMGWHLESISLDGKDLVTTPLVLENGSVTNIVWRFTRQRSRIAGVVRRADGTPAPQAAVIAFPANYRAWIDQGLSPSAARVVPVSQTGAYELSGLTTGDFLIAAADASALVNWQVSTIEALAPAATRVTMARGDAKTQDLTVRTVR